MLRQRIDLSIHHDDGLLAIEGIVDELVASDLVVFVDVATADDVLVDKVGCQEVRSQLKGSAVAREHRAGVSYPLYYTCLVASGREASALARVARLTSELRLRAYVNDPGESIAYGWQPTDFWDAEAQRSEEANAIVVAKTRDDATAIDLRVADAFRTRILRTWLPKAI